MHERKRIFEKVIKLLALSGSPHSGEAEAARQAAVRLMAKYNVTAGELRPEEEITQKVYETRYIRIPREISTLHAVIAAHVGCASYLQPGYRDSTFGTQHAKLFLVGRQADMEVAEYLIGVISRQIDDLASSRNGRTKSYRLGLIAGVQEMLKQLTRDTLSYQQKEGLVPVDESAARTKDAERWFAQEHKIGYSRRSPISDFPDFHDGYGDARSINIFAPVESHDDSLKALK